MERSANSTLTSILIACLIYRLLFAIFTRTTFVPDEYYQHGDVALHLSHGLGLLTWEWKAPFFLRSYLPLFPSAILFRLLQVVHFDNASILAIVPRLLQGLLTSAADLAVYRIVCDSAVGTSKSGDNHCRVAYVCLAVHLFSWSCSYCLSRPLINSFEATTGLILLREFINCYGVGMVTARGKVGSKVFLAMAVAALIYVRPTAVLLWVPAYASLAICSPLYHRCSSCGGEYGNRACVRPAWCRCASLATEAALCTPAAAFALLSCWVLDMAVTGRAIAPPPWNFFKYNVLQKYAERYYGSSPWHWNASSGMPTMLGLYTPLLLYGVLFTRVPATVRWLLALSFCYAVGLSGVTSHHEIRFLLPCLAPAHILVGFVATELIESQKASRRIFLVLVAGAHLFVAIYLARFHQAGGEAAFLCLSHQMQSRQFPPATHVSVLALAPCHSFPGYAFLHPGSAINPGTRIKIRIVSPDCSPPPSSFAAPTGGRAAAAASGGGVEQRRISESDKFRRDPREYLEKQMLALSELGKSTPTHVIYAVSFDGYMSRLGSDMERNGFKEIARIRHSIFRYDYDDPIHHKYALIFERDN